MNRPRFFRSTRTTIFAAISTSAVVLCSVGAGYAWPNSGPTRSGIAASRAETPTYEAEIVGAGSYKAGAEGTVKVTVLAKGGYHVNPQYPYKFKTAPPSDGLSFPKPILQRADGTFEETRATFMVPFVAAKAGKSIVGGTLHLGVCNAGSCVTDKVLLEVAVEVK